MDHFGILKRAFKIVWRYRALWVFGVLLALTSGNGGNGGNGLRYVFNFNGDNRPGGGVMSPFKGSWPFADGFQWPDWRLGSMEAGTLIAIIVGAVIVLLMLGIIGTIIRYVAENALIKMVDKAETTGAAGSVGEGFRWGWSRPAWRMFLADLVIGIPFFFAILALLAIGLSPLLLLLVKTTGTRVLAIVLTIGLMLLVLAVLIIAGVIIGVLLNFVHRELALAGKGVLEAIASAWDLLRRHSKDIGLVWLLMLGVGIGWGLVMIVVVLAFLVVGGLISVGPGLALYGLTKSVIAGLAVGIPLFLLTFVAPLVFISGLYHAFVSSVWTLTYRDVKAMERRPVAPTDAPPAELEELPLVA